MGQVSDFIRRHYRHFNARETRDAAQAWVDLLDRGGFRVNPDGTFSVDEAKIKDAVTALTTELLTIQAEGDYDGAKAILDRLAVIRPETRRVLDRLEEIPVDIEPRFVTAQELTGR